MSRIYSFEFNGQHEAEAAVITCVDFRFIKLVLRFVQEYLVTTFDLFTIPGVGKKFVSGEAYATEVTEAIDKVSVRSHRIDKLIVISHWDCAGYGGSAAFPSPEKEEEIYRQDLLAAKEILCRRFPKLKILIGYVRLRGVFAEFIMID